MANGGIFDMQSVLGLPTAMDGDGGLICDLYTNAYSKVAQQVQEKLVSMGVTGLVVDGKWGLCSEDAYFLVFGESTSADSLRRNVGITCEKFDKIVRGTCAQQAIYMPTTSTQRSLVKFPQMTTASVSTMMPKPFPGMVSTPQQPMNPFAPQTSASAMVPASSPASLPQVPGVPAPYNPPMPGYVTGPAPEATPWVKYSLIAAAVAGVGLVAWWYLGGKEPEPELTPPPGRTQPVGTIE